jgi:hypothetical protein
VRSARRPAIWLSTSAPAAALISRSASSRSSGGSRARPSSPLWSSTHRASRSAVRLLPSANPCARVTRKASTPAATTGSWMSSIDASARSTRSRSSGSLNHSSDSRTARLIAVASASDGRLNALADRRAARGTRPGAPRATRDRHHRPLSSGERLVAQPRSLGPSYRSMAIHDRWRAA